MRVLFAGLSSVGHTYPMIPLAVAARDAGHEVHWTAGDAVHEALAADGLRPFRPADSFHEVYAEDLEPELARLRPDLVVHGWGVPGAAVAARRVGVPGLWHGFGRMFPEGIGLAPPAEAVPGLPHLDICPPSLQDEDFLATARRVALRPVALRPVAHAEPGALPARRGSRALVHLTLGTAFGTPELLTAAVAGLATLGALAVGVPQLLLPQGADQFVNADALAASASGAGLRLLPGEQDAEAVADLVLTLLAHRAHRDAARGLTEEIARMPSPAEVARRLPEFA
ncbi:glycosyltransferase [Saccharothrix yanglingensis]|uniref:Glycosyl transferase n=1 Tax=Saccharothrix yanglingensis TaxID=659496 RepID=A0ABU0WZ21_9PSEU|nr:nucleotide disphospho-sugar-binding domain-containing protein [Saccharothrix yanglingensis]MDQ2585051.1 glycosyl transferase [Saccharothrix yanglingensis]